MNSNEKCVTALQALLNVTYASGPGKLAPPPRVFLEDFNDGTLYSTTVSGHALGASVFPPEITRRGPLKFFLFQGWLIDGFSFEKNMAIATLECGRNPCKSLTNYDVIDVV